MSALESLRTMVQDYHASYPDVIDLSPQEVKRCMQLAEKKGTRFLLVDVRTTVEQNISMLPGAIRQSDFEKLNLRSQSEGGPVMVVFYCTVGYRSGKYCQQLMNEQLNRSEPANSDAAGATRSPVKQYEYIQYCNLGGSLLAWAWNKGTFVDSFGRPTSRVHVFGQKWALLPEGYEPVWFGQSFFSGCSIL
eukprot:gb/GEZN01019066.1/.p1 GENE.gb/GEZN01019066.1/~~gb/GEZN01019066.1/.p1  ORF type:complete len:191 (+),score=12.39 gb/GEZN01019066.1/:12-584(+)